MAVINWCTLCEGNHGFYVMPNGDQYINDEPGGVWTACEHCDGTGVEPGNEVGKGE